MNTVCCFISSKQWLQLWYKCEKVVQIYFSSDTETYNSDAHADKTNLFKIKTRFYYSKDRGGSRVLRKMVF